MTSLRIWRRNEVLKISWNAAKNLLGNTGYPWDDVDKRFITNDGLERFSYVEKDILQKRFFNSFTYRLCPQICAVEIFIKKIYLDI